MHTSNLEHTLKCEINFKLNKKKLFDLQRAHTIRNLQNWLFIILYSLQFYNFEVVLLIIILVKQMQGTKNIDDHKKGE